MQAITLLKCFINEHLVSITVSVMLQSNHYITIQQSHGVITNFGDLQMFLCLTTHKLTHVPCRIGLVQWPLTTCNLRRDPLVVPRPPPNSGSTEPPVRPPPPSEFTSSRKTNYEGMLTIVLKANVHTRGGASSGNSLRPCPASTIVAHHRQGSILMSRTCDKCEQVPPKNVTLIHWD
jgi:hypothetical protein